jgi:membrane protein involved in colicin uptake
VDGDKVGTEQVSHHYKGMLGRFTFTSLTKGTCASVDWKKNVNWNPKYDGANGSAFTEYTAYEKKRMAREAAEKKAAAEKAAAAKRAAALKAAQEKIAAETWDKFHGEAHFIQNNYCIQLNGKLAGNEENYKSLY